MFGPNLNSKQVFKYPFGGGKKLQNVLKGQNILKETRSHIFCLATADSVSISVLPTNCSKVQ